MVETIPPRSPSERYKEKPPKNDREPEQRKDEVPAVTHHGLVSQMNEHISQNVDIGLVRLNYRFGGPVIAKY